MTAAQFTPTERQKDLLRALLTSTAFANLAKQEQDRIYTDILAKGSFRFSEVFLTENMLRRLGDTIPADRIMRDPKQICMLEGLSGRETVGSAKLFFDMADEAMKPIFADGGNAECIARSEQLKNEWAFLEATWNIHKIKDVRALMMDDRKRLLDLTVSLFLAVDGMKEYVTDGAYQIAYYNERMQVS